jgi:hypothetical protein
MTWSLLKKPFAEVSRGQNQAIGSRTGDDQAVRFERKSLPPVNESPLGSRPLNVAGCWRVSRILSH